MAALIKNALIKQLSKFLKNVSANQINISTLKGEGEMKNIQLDENVLMDLIELPTWLRITNAKCNKASVKIQWTKLKTNPIVIFLDKIELDMEIADPLRDYSASSANSKLFDKDSTGPYGFIDKCIDAIQLNIDSITITIKSKLFNANLNMSNICVYSVTPNWKLTNDIRNTRLKDLEKEEIILFKEISWEICRLEAYNVESGQQNQSTTSIKLIMNPSKIQIALKKKLSDKSLINSTFRVLLNEIYWMANDTQLKSAIRTYNTISKLMKKSFTQKRRYAYFQQQQQQQQTAQNKQKSAHSPIKNNNPNEKNSNLDISKVFLHYDIQETSLHLHVSTLNIHLYADDNYSGNKLIDGGAMQFLFKNVCIDHYPYHKVGSSIKHWHNYNPTFKQREEWSKKLFNEFVNKLETIINKSNIKDINLIRLKNNLNLLESCTIFNLKDFCIYKVTTNMSNKLSSTIGMKNKKLNQELEQTQSNSNVNSPNDYLKMKNYFLDQQLYNSRQFLSSNFSELNLPNETLFANFFFSEFYFPEDVNYPVPSPQIFIQISPVLLNIDFLTLLWINTLLFSLWREKLLVDQNNTSDSTSTYRAKFVTENNSHTKIPNLHCDTYFELIMPKISLSIYPKKLNLNPEAVKYEPRPSGIEIGFSHIIATNQNLSVSKYLDYFKSTTDKCYKVSKSLREKNSNFNLFDNKTKIVDANSNDSIKLNLLAPCFNDIIKNEDLAYLRYDISSNDDKMINTINEAKNAELGLFLKCLNKNALQKSASKDIWTINVESMWIDMLDYEQNQSFVENTSFKIYLTNVWDFYNSSIISSKPLEERILKPKSVNNYKKAYQRLGKIIEIGNSGESLKPAYTTSRKRSNSLISSSNLVKSKTKSNNLYKRIYSNLNIIGELNDLRVNCNHSQILFLLRLIDTIDIFTNQIKIDTEQTLKYNNENNQLLKTNDANKKFKIKSIKLEDLENCNIQEEENLDEFSVNLAFIINNVEINLNINDLRKDIITESKAQENVLNSYQELNNIKSFLSNLKEEKESSITSDSLSSHKSISKEDFDLIARQFDKELMIKYIKYIYGLSTENPNLGFSFQSANLNDSGFISSDKSSLSVSFSSKNLSSQINKIASKITESSDSDIFIDDNDNLSVIMSLEQDDTSSIVSIEATNTIVDNAQIRSFSLTSETSSVSSAANIHIIKTNESSANLLESQKATKTTDNNKLIQTSLANTIVKLKLKNLNLYFQSFGENLTALASLDEIELRNRKSCLYTGLNTNNLSKEILVRFKKLTNDPKSSNGLLELRLENFKLEADVPTLNGLVDLIDDNDDFLKEKKDTIPIDIFIKNCNFNLNDDPFKSFLENPKLINISIESLFVNKTNDNKLIINEFKMDNNLNGINKNQTKDMHKEIEFLSQFKYDLTFLEFNSKFKFNSNKFASLVYLLRKSKEENHKLQLKYKQEKIFKNSEKETILAKLNLYETENQELKKEIERLKNDQNHIEVKQKQEQEQVETNNSDEMEQKIELERKQFDALLRGFQEENEFLKTKLKKSEDYIALLNIERECLMKKLNQSKF